MIVKLKNHPKAKVVVVLRSSGQPVLLARALRSVLSQAHKEYVLYLMFDQEPSTDCVRVLKDNARVFPEMLIGVGEEQEPSRLLSADQAMVQILLRLELPYVAIHQESDTWHPDFLKECLAKFYREPSLAAVASKFKIVHERLYQDGVFSVGGSDPERGFPYYIGVTDIAADRELPQTALVLNTAAVRRIGNYFDVLKVQQWRYQLKLASWGNIAVLGRTLVTKHESMDTDDVQAGHKESQRQRDEQELLRGYINNEADRLGIVTFLQTNQTRLLGEFGHLHRRLDDQVKINADLVNRLMRVEQLLTEATTKKRWWSIFDWRE